MQQITLTIQEDGSVEVEMDDGQSMSFGSVAEALDELRSMLAGEDEMMADAESPSDREPAAEMGSEGYGQMWNEEAAKRGAM